MVLFHAPGSCFGHFVVTKVKDIDEIQVRMIALKHQTTGAHVLCLLNQDPENVFAIGLNTYPDSSNGVAHVLEHVVLCGSRKFPVKDPFFGMQKRSLATFMNAFTGIDFTCYPASSIYEEDFYHLLEVYLDAVFAPRLLRLSFLQEGIRLDLNEGNISFEGIVLNEMKGALSSPDARLERLMYQHLFPDSVYGYNSGGDPQEIVKLSYRDLKDFHSRYYHPSNTLFFFYGSFPIEKHLLFLEEHCLQHWKQQPIERPKLVTSWEGPCSIEGNYPSVGDKSQDQPIYAIGFVVCDLMHQEDVMMLSILDLVFCGTDAGILRKPLLDSGLCKQVDSEYDVEIAQVPWILICKSVAEANKEPLRELIHQVLFYWATHPIDPELIAGALHQLQMSRLEITDHGVPYGLHLYFRSGLLQQHGGVPEDGLEIHRLFARCKQLLEDPSYLSSVVHRFFIDNPHRVELMLMPDSLLHDGEAKKEKEILTAIYDQLTPKKKEELIAQKAVLQKYQNEEDDEEVLPKLSLEAIPKYPVDYSLQERSFHTIPCYIHRVFTNRIFYFDMLYDLPHIPQEELLFLRLFSYVAPQVGTQQHTFQHYLDRLIRYTGGIYFHTDFFPQVDDFHCIHPKISVRTKALYEYQPQAFDLVAELLYTVSFRDKTRLIQLLQQHLVHLQMSLSEKSLHYGLHLASSAFSHAGRMQDQLWGIGYYLAIRPWLEHCEERIDEMIGYLENMKERLFRSPCCCVLSGCDAIEQEVLRYPWTVPSKEGYAPWFYDYTFPVPLSQARPIASAVGYHILALPTVPYTHPAAPHLTLAAQIIEDYLLHPQIREQGGAYGAGCSNSMLPGYFYFYSYRDPHLVSTYEVYHHACTEFITSIEESMLTAAKFCVIQDMDDPVAPGNRAIVSCNRIFSGNDFERRARYRKGILDATLREVKEAFIEYIAPSFNQAIRITFSGMAMLEQHRTWLQDQGIQILPL